MSHLTTIGLRLIEKNSVGNADAELFKTISESDFILGDGVLVDLHTCSVFDDSQIKIACM